VKSVQDRRPGTTHDERMVQAFRTTREIGRPVDEVWRQLTDWDRAAGWLGVDSIRADGPTRVGTTLRFTTRGKERTSEIAALDPGRSVTLRSRQGGVTADYTYAVEPHGAGTRVTLVADVVTRGLWRVAAPAIRVAIRRTDAGQLDALDRRGPLTS
jgi:uncharacterized protein YndB with AHSA1/START domain